jgi:hypothetical protein
LVPYAFSKASKLTLNVSIERVADARWISADCNVL